MEKANFRKRITGLAELMVIVAIIVCNMQIFAAEGDKPMITSASPADKAYNVQLNEKMTVTFDMSVDFSTATKGNITVNGKTDLIKNIITDIATPQRIVIEFETLEYLTAYAVTFENIKSLTGVSMDKKTITFVTQDAPGQILMHYDMEANEIPNGAAGVANAPNYYTTTYAHGGTRSLMLNLVDTWAKAGWYKHGEVYRPGKTMKFSFWARIEAGARVNEIDVGLNGDHRAVVIGKIQNLTPGADFVFCSFLYTMPLNFDGDCLVWFAVPGAGVIYIDDFTVELAGDTKILPISTPMDKAENVAVSSMIDLYFNYNIDASSTTTANIKINDGAVPILFLQTVGNRIPLILDKPLEYDKRYKISYNIKDVMGRNVSGERTFRAERRYGIEKLEIYKDYGSANQVKLANLQQGNVSAVASGLRNNASTDGTVVLITALYKDNAMIDTQYVNITAFANTTLSEPVSVAMAIPQLSNGEYYLKAYLWDEYNGIQSIDRVKIAE